MTTSLPPPRRGAAPRSRVGLVDVDAQPGREPGDLAAPLLRDAHRADDERGADPGLLLSLETSAAIACTVLPSPMSSARIPPTRRSPSSRSQPWPRSWNGKRSWRMPGGRSDRYRRSPASASSSSSAASSRTWPSWTPASSVSSRLPRELDHADRPLPALEEPQGALDLGGPERVPPSAQADERLLRGGELGELLRVSSTSPIARRQSNDAIASRVRMPLGRAPGQRRG